MGNKVISHQTFSFWCLRNRVARREGEGRQFGLFRSNEQFEHGFEHEICKHQCSEGVCPIWHRLRTPEEYIANPKKRKR